MQEGAGSAGRGGWAQGWPGAERGEGAGWWAGVGGPAPRPRPLPGPPRPHAGPRPRRRSAHRRACGPAWRGRGTPPPRGSTRPSPRLGWWPPPPAPCRPARRRRPPRPPPWPGRPATSPQRERARSRPPRRRTCGAGARSAGSRSGPCAAPAQAQAQLRGGPRGALWRPAPAAQRGRHARTAEALRWGGGGAGCASPGSAPEPCAPRGGTAASLGTEALQKKSRQLTTPPGLGSLQLPLPRPDFTVTTGLRGGYCPPTRPTAEAGPDPGAGPSPGAGPRRGRALEEVPRGIDALPNQSRWLRSAPRAAPRPVPRPRPPALGPCWRR